MKVLFIGGTGNISTAVTQLAAERGIDLTLLRRGERAADLPAKVRTITADIHDEAVAAQALAGESFDSVVDWIAFTPEHIERDLRLFRGRTRQFIFISSASAYQKPATQHIITESTPLANPCWQYSRDKIACEERLMRAYREEGFPITIVRPSHTYGDTQLPLALNPWQASWTAVDRMRRGNKVIVPGDGSSLWVVTHNTDFALGFVGLLGHPQAIGHAFHITSDEVLSWNQIYRITAQAAGVEPRIVHIASDFLTACLPDELGGLTGDKSVCVVFDNSKIKHFVP
ncbi:MAG: SDR family oxidoreductase, partial [Terracidiphilus sp.]